MGIGSSILALTTASVLALGGVAYADILRDNITGNGSVSLNPGSSQTGTATVTLQGQGGDNDAGCNVDNGETLLLNVLVPSGVTATPNPLSITACDAPFTVTFSADSTAVSGSATVSVHTNAPGNGTYTNNVDIPITINTKPTVAVTGVQDGASYTIGSVPAAKCSITDTEDGNSTQNAVLSGTLTNGLGQQTATCDYTDDGGLKADTKTATYTIVAANTKPSVAVTGVENGATYTVGSVPVAECSITDTEDGNSTKDAVLSGTASNVPGQQTATCDYTDKGGLKADTKTATYTIVAANTKPSVAVTGVEDGAIYVAGSVPAATCSITDAEDGNKTVAAVVSNLPADGLGSHTVTCDYTDNGGLKADTKTAAYTVVRANTKPTVTVTGFKDGATYEVSAAPDAVCSVTDEEDGPSTVAAQISNLPANGVGDHTVACDYTDQGGLKADTATASYTIIPDNTGPSVDLIGVTDGAVYEKSSVPAATCQVSDLEDGDSTFAAALSGTLTDGLGDQTATCEYSDNGGLTAAPESATYRIIADNTAPSVELAGVENGVTYELSKVPDAVCEVTDLEDGPSSKPAELSGTLTGGLGEQTATCDHTDKGGLKAAAKSATYTIIADNTAPSVELKGVTDGAIYERSKVPAATCEVTDLEDGPSTKDAVLTGSLVDGLGQQTATCTHTDKGGLAAEIKSAIYTIIADNTAPTVKLTGVEKGATYELSLVPEAVCEITDLEDGNSTKAAALSELTDKLGEQTATCEHTDKGGLQAVPQSVTYTVIPDNTAPTVAVTGVKDGGAYEIGAVPTAKCSVTDLEDGNSVHNAIISGSLTHGLGSQTATCGHTDKGGLIAQTATATYTVVDTGKPTIEGKLNPLTPGGSNGWYTGGVRVEFECDDSGSGIAKCEGDTTLSDGADQSITGTATDRAGNTATDTVSGINVDGGKPTITGKLTPGTADGANGWYTTEVDVDFTCEDSVSGIDSCTPKKTLGDGANQSVTGTATDRAGNIATDTLTGINVDTLKPTIEGSIDSATPAPKNGWYSQDVLVGFACADTGSGIASCTPATKTQGEGEGLSVSGTAIDKAGHTASDTVSGIKVDKTGPTGITVSGVSDYFFGSAAGTASCTATDALSGIDTCEVTGFAQTAVNTYTATAKATDLAGNSTTEAVTYQVKPWKATGFYSPVDMGSTVNTVKGGSTVPLKFEVFGAAELTRTTVVTSFTQKQVTCGALTGIADEVEVTTTGKTELRYDAVAGQFIQNWQTPKTVGACYVVTMKLEDGTSLVANFKLK